MGQLEKETRAESESRCGGCEGAAEDRAAWRGGRGGGAGAGPPSAVAPVAASSVLMPEAVCHRGLAREGVVTGSEGGAGFPVRALRERAGRGWLSGERWPLSLRERLLRACAGDEGEWLALRFQTITATKEVDLQGRDEPGDAGEAPGV